MSPRKGKESEYFNKDMKIFDEHGLNRKNSLEPAQAKKSLIQHCIVDLKMS